MFVFFDTEMCTTLRLTEGDHTNIMKKLREHAASWRDIGKNLGFTEGQLNNISLRPLLQGTAPESLLGEVLYQWLQWSPVDGQHNDFATIKGLQAALKQAGLGALAHDLCSYNLHTCTQ